MYLSPMRESLLPDPTQPSRLPPPPPPSPPIPKDSGLDLSSPQFTLPCDNENTQTSLQPTSGSRLTTPLGYEQGGETYYISRQWETDGTVSNIQHASLTNRKLIQNADFKFSRTEELSFENSRYHNYMTDSDINVTSGENVSGFKSTDVNVRKLLKENVKQYAKVVNNLPAGDNKNDLSMFRQMAASCGIHVEDPKSPSSENFEIQKAAVKLPNDTASPRKIEQTMVLGKDKAPYGSDCLSDIEPEMESLKLEYSAIEVVSKNVNVSDAWEPNWLNAGFCSDNVESYVGGPYSSSKLEQISQTASTYNSFTSHNDSDTTSFQSNNIQQNEVLTSPPRMMDRMAVGHQLDVVARNVCFPIEKEWSQRFLPNSDSCNGLPININTNLNSPRPKPNIWSSDIKSSSTQTDPGNVELGGGDSIALTAKKLTFNRGNQVSVLMKDASVNVGKPCVCSDKYQDFSAKEISTQTEFTSTGNLQERTIAKISNTWTPLADVEVNRQFLADQNLNPSTCLPNNSYFGDQYTGAKTSTFLQTPLKNQIRDSGGEGYAEYNSNTIPDIAILNTPPQSPETAINNSEVPFVRNDFWTNVIRPTDSPCFPDPGLRNANEIKLDFNLYCLVLEKLRQLYPALTKVPQELQLLAKRQTLALQIHRSQMHYSYTEEPRAITKINPLHLSAQKEMEANKFLHNLSTTLSPTDRDIDYMTPDESPPGNSNNNGQRRSDASDFRYMLSPPYRKFQTPPFSPKSDWNTKPVIPEMPPKTTQMEWTLGFSPIIPKHEAKDSDKCGGEIANPDSPKVIMKRAEKSSWNNPVMPASVITKTANLKYQSPNPKDCLPIVGANEFHGNNFQQAFKRKKRLQFAMEQNKQNLTAKIDANIRKGNYERLVQVMQERLPNTDRTKVDDLIREVRRRKNGLGGLTMREIVLEAKSILQEKTRLYPNNPGTLKEQPFMKPVTKADTQCSLCVEDLKLKLQKQLDCGHNFHDECIMAWVYRHERSCPTCGQLVLFPEEYPKLA